MPSAARAAICQSRGTRLSRVAHMPDKLLARCRARDFCGARHLPLEIVGNSLRRDSALDSFNDKIRRVSPAQVFEQHGARENDRAGIYHVLARVLWRRAMRGF